MAYLTGAASILDISGCTRRFEELSAPARRAARAGSRWEGDLEAISGDLQTALSQYLDRMSDAQCRALAQALSDHAVG